jgi:hypothetical protein
MSGTATFMQNLGASGNPPLRPAYAVFQDIAHASPPNALHQTRREHNTGERDILADLLK